MAQVIVPAGQTTLPSISDNDDILFAEGGQTLTGGTLDQSALATGLTNVTINPQSSVSTTPNQPLFAAINGVFRNFGAGGVFYVRPQDDGAGDVDEAIHSGFGTTHFVTGGTVDILRVNNGTVRIDDAVDVNNLFMTGGSVIQGFNSTANNAWTVDGGTFNTERGLDGSGFVGPNATVTVKRKNTNATRPTHATGTLTITGHVNWQGGNMNAVLGYGTGRLDLSAVTANITIASLTCTSAFRQRSVLQSANPGVTITITNTFIIDGLDEVDGKRMAYNN